jgi:hypothetical protein
MQQRAIFKTGNRELENGMNGENEPGINGESTGGKRVIAGE